MRRGAALIYATAAYAGLRRLELQRIGPTAVEWSADQFKLAVPTGIGKLRRVDRVPIGVDLALALHRHAQDDPGRSHLFAMPGNFSNALGVDLAAAGIPRNTADGIVDFQSLRNTFTAMLIESGASAAVIFSLQRVTTTSIWPPPGSASLTDSDRAKRWRRLPPLPASLIATPQTGGQGA